MIDTETFRQWFERRYGTPYPGRPDELAPVVFGRIADAVAEWADLMAKRAAEKD